MYFQRGLSGQDLERLLNDAVKKFRKLGKKSFAEDHELDALVDLAAVGFPV